MLHVCIVYDQRGKDADMQAFRVTHGAMTREL
jgi:hypothetical protein